MKKAAQVLEAFDNVRRAQTAGVYAPHKPPLILLALARVQRNEPRLVEFRAIEDSMRALLTEFGPSGSAKSRHYPFWHPATDGQRALWDLRGPQEVLSRPPSATPNLGELRAHHEHYWRIAVVRHQTHSLQHFLWFASGDCNAAGAAPKRKIDGICRRSMHGVAMAVR